MITRGSGERNKNFVRSVRSSGILGSFDWQLVTGISGKPMGPIFKEQTVHIAHLAWNN